MKNAYSFLVLFFAVHLGISQETKLRVLGNINYIETAESRVLLLNFENDPRVCNPLTQNKTIEVQVQDLNAKLKLEKTAFQLVHKETLSVNPERSKYYELVLPLTTPMYAILKNLSLNGIEVAKTYYQFPEKVFRDEDAKALLAVQDSQRKANVIVKTLHYQIAGIINVDDVTSDVSWRDYIDEEERERLNSINDSLYLREVDSNPTKSSYYNLWVTYSVKPL